MQFGCKYVLSCCSTMHTQQIAGPPHAAFQYAPRQPGGIRCFRRRRSTSCVILGRMKLQSLPITGPSGPASACASREQEQQSAGSTSRRTVLRGTAAGVLCCAACGGGPNGSGCDTSSWPGRWGWYDKYFAFGMANTMAEYEAEIAPLKRQLFAAAVTPGAHVLELGIGTAPNLKYYAGQRDVHITGVDVNTSMQSYAREAAASAGLPPDRLSLVTGDVQQLPLESGSFDLVVCTLVLCSVPDVHAALREAARVLKKPGGRFLFIEHVLASEERRLLRLQQRLLDPLQQLAADNCHLTRDTGSMLRNSGLFRQVLEEQTFEVAGMGLIGPHVAGIADV